MAHEGSRPYVPGFQEDVFLSYAHIDNLEGWVDDFHRLLDSRLRGLLGPSVRIWRDPRLHEGAALWETLEPTVSGSALFVPILSPSYVQSPSCRREARHFHEVAAARGLVGTSCRLVQVVKIPFEHHPESRFLEAIESIQCRFFEPDAQDPTRFHYFPSRTDLPHYSNFDIRLNELVQSLADILQKMHSKLAEPEPSSSRVSVFLATTATDRKPDRAFVAQEIGALCELRSTADLPLTKAELTAELSRELSGCALSVHLLGSSYGPVPEGEDVRSSPWLQFDAAASARRLVWIPEDLQEVEPRQQRFLDEVKACRDPKLEVPQQGLSDFVQDLKDLLRKLAQPPRVPVHGKAIYVVSHELDRARHELKQVRNCILHEGVRIEPQAVKAADENLRLAEEQALRDSDAVLLYWGDAPDDWVITRQKKIRQILTTLEHGTRYRRALYLSVPDGGGKEQFKALPGGLFPEGFGPPLLVLGDFGGFDCGKLEALLRAVKESGP